MRLLLSITLRPHPCENPLLPYLAVVAQVAVLHQHSIRLDVEGGVTPCDSTLANLSGRPLVDVEAGATTCDSTLPNHGGRPWIHDNALKKVMYCTGGEGSATINETGKHPAL